MAEYCSKTNGTTITDTTTGTGGEVLPPRKVDTSTTVTMTLFLLTLFQINTIVFINYTSGTVIKLFKYTTEKQPETFDVEYKGMNLFEKKLLEIAKKSR